MPEKAVFSRHAPGVPLLVVRLSTRELIDIGSVTTKGMRNITAKLLTLHHCSQVTVENLKSFQKTPF